MFFVARGLRKRLVLPAAALAARVREVAGGDYEREVAADGTVEVVDLAARRRHDARADRRRAGGAARGRGRPQALQRRARAVRLRRVARPPGAAAQGRELLPAAAAALRRAARRSRRPVHRLRRRRRAADAGPDQRPAGVLARRPARAARTPTSTATRCSSACARTSRGSIEESGARDRRRAAADRARRRRAAAARVPEPVRQRDQVPRRGGAGGPDRRRARRRVLALPLRRQRDRDRRRVRGADLRALPAPAPAHAVRGHRDRARDVPEDRRVPRRPDVARHRAAPTSPGSTFYFTLPAEPEDR